MKIFLPLISSLLFCNVAAALAQQPLNVDSSGNPTTTLNLSGPHVVISTASSRSTLYVDSAALSSALGVRGTTAPFPTLAAALAAAQSGDVIVMRPGIYKSAGTATVSVSNVMILGQGAVIMATDQTDVVKISINASDCTIRDLEINGVWTNATDVDNGAITVSAPRAKLEDVYVHGSAGYAIRFVMNFDGSIVQHCRADHCGSGVRTAMYGTSDVDGLEVSYCAFTNNRAGGIRATNNSAGAHAIKNEKYIGNYIWNNGPGSIGIELWGGGISGYATVPHQNAIVSSNNIGGSGMGISMNACSKSVVSENVIFAGTYCGIEFANSNSNVAGGNMIDCTAGGEGYAVSNNNNDTGRGVDLHITGGSVFNGVGADAVHCYNVSGVTVNSLYARQNQCAFLIQLCADITIKNCRSDIAGSAYGVFTEVASGGTASGLYYEDNKFNHFNTNGNDTSIFAFYSGNGSGAINNVYLRNNSTDSTFCGGGFVWANVGVYIKFQMGNFPFSTGSQGGFLNTHDTQTAETVTGNVLSLSTSSYGLSLVGTVEPGVGGLGRLQILDAGTPTTALEVNKESGSYLLRSKMPLVLDGGVSDSNNASSAIQITTNPYPDGALMVSYTVAQANGNASIGMAGSNPYVLQTGDFLEYDIYQDGSSPNFCTSVDARLSNGNYLHGYALSDQNGLAANYSSMAAYAVGRWYHRKISLATTIGLSFADLEIFSSNQNAQTGTYTIYLRRVMVTNSGKLVASLYDNNIPATASLLSSSNISAFSVKDGYQRQLSIPGGTVMRLVSVPATSLSTGRPGDEAKDANYLYVYTGDGVTHSWRRTALQNF